MFKFSPNSALVIFVTSHSNRTGGRQAGRKAGWEEGRMGVRQDRREAEQEEGRIKVKKDRMEASLEGGRWE